MKAMSKPRADQPARALPLVTVVIPVYNRRELVPQTLDSVLVQDWPRVEIVVVDDGSTDGTADDVRKKYSGRVRVLRQENRGPSAARNAGFVASQGDFLASVDSDDELPAGSIRARAEALRANPDAGLAYGLRLHQYRDGTWSDRKLAPPEDTRAWPRGDLLAAQVEKPFIGHTDIMFRRSLLPADGKLYDEEMHNHEDFMAVLKLLARADAVPAFTHTTHVRSVAGKHRQRVSHRTVLSQGLAPLDRALADPVLAERLSPMIDTVRAHLLLAMSSAAWHAGDGRLCREYMRRARAYAPGLARRPKYSRRYLLSFFRFIFRTPKDHSEA